LQADLSESGGSEAVTAAFGRMYQRVVRLHETVAAEYRHRRRGGPGGQPDDDREFARGDRAVVGVPAEQRRIRDAAIELVANLHLRAEAGDLEANRSAEDFTRAAHLLYRSSPAEHAVAVRLFLAVAADFLPGG
jgi:hypothetical protein